MASKRINRELKVLCEEYGEENIIVDDITTDTGRYIELKKKITINKNKSIIVSCSDYPFKAPTLLINNKEYYEFFKTKSKRILKLLHENGNVGCMCCSSILCNWTPTYTFKSILKEIENFNNIKRQIKYKIFMDEFYKSSKYPKFVMTYILEFL